MYKLDVGDKLNKGYKVWRSRLEEWYSTGKKMIEKAENVILICFYWFNLGFKVGNDVNFFVNMITLSGQLSKRKY